MTDGALDDYLERLVFGAVFARNQYGESIVVASGIGPDATLSVLCNSSTGINDWALAKVYVEAGEFCHESGGTFFKLQGVMKAYCRAIGEVFEESIDDYA